MLRRLLFCTAALAYASCANDPPGGCVANSDCAGGQVCEGGTCLRLCSADRDCGAGLVCSASACVTGARNLPQITGVNGDSGTPCPQTPNDCITGGILVTGASLDGASFALLSPSGPVDLIRRNAGNDTEVILDLPSDVVAGEYRLTATNAAGSADQQLNLLQGLPGENFTPTSNELVDSINSATNVIDAQRVPHSHSEYLQLGGGTLTGALSGTSATFNGPVRVGATASACAGDSAGALRFDVALSTLYACDGSRWVALYRARGNGASSAQAAESCKAILDDGFSTGDGVYWLRAQAAGAPYQVYCDMTTAGGGWTMVAKLDGQSSVMNRNNKAQWLDGVAIGNTTTLAAENALGEAYKNVAFTDVMIRGVANATKNLGWRHPAPFSSMWDVVRTETPVSTGARLFGSIENLDRQDPGGAPGDAAYHNECPDLRFGFNGFDYFYRFNTTPGRFRTTGHVGGIVAASRFEITTPPSNSWAHPSNCISDFGFGGGYYDMLTADDQYNINAHWWGAGNDNTHFFNAHALFVR